MTQDRLVFLPLTGEQADLYIYLDEICDSAWVYKDGDTYTVEAETGSEVVGVNGGDLTEVLAEAVRRLEDD